MEKKVSNSGEKVTQNGNAAKIQVLHSKLLE